MTRRCDRCGCAAVDAVGERQASLFDVAPASPLATPEARAELRAGRVLCTACQRTGELYPDPYDRCARMMSGEIPFPVAAATVASEFEVSRDDIDGDVDRGMAAAFTHAEQAERAQAIADLRAEPCQVWGPAHDNGDGTERRSTLEPFPVKPYDRERVTRELAEDDAVRAREKRAGKRRKDWRGAAKAEAWDRERDAGRR